MAVQKEEPPEKAICLQDGMARPVSEAGGAPVKEEPMQVVEVVSSEEEDKQVPPQATSWCSLAMRTLKAELERVPCEHHL